MTRRMGAALALRDLTEKEWDAQLFNTKKGLATTLGWALCYHTLRSKGSKSGFPDRVLIRDRVIFAELKREDGKPSDTQRDWLTGLAHAGAETYLWRPSDLDEIAQILAWRGAFIDSGNCYALHQADHDGWWQPRTLWLPSGHRNDDNVQEVIAA